MKDLSIHGRPSELSMYAPDELSRAVVISLFSWARAHDDDKVEGRRRYGFWGDTYADDAGERTGSRLWLLAREKVMAETIERARQYAEEALQWLIEDAVADSVAVTAERAGLDRVDLLVTIERGRDSRTLRYDDVWRRLGNGV